MNMLMNQKLKKTSGFVLALIFGMALCAAGDGWAQQQQFSVDRAKALFLPNITYDGPGANALADSKATAIEPPIEPFFKQVKFLNQIPAKTLTERVDRLTHGIKIDIPPEYDHFGYEIRRYMKSILTPNDLNNTMLIPEKLQNARRARVIMDYWKKALYDEMASIEKEMDKGDVSITLKTTYRYNAGIVNVFIPEVYAWVDSNIEFLELLQQNGGEFYVSYPYYEVPNPTVRQRVQDLYGEREAALQSVIKYSPFRAMIY